MKINNRDIENILAKYHNNSYALAVVKNNEIIYQKFFGLANVEKNIQISLKTNFRLASVSKQFIAVAIMLLVV